MNTTTPTLEPATRLNKDIRAAIGILSVDEARFLVDTYYQIQKFRQASANQVRSLDKSEEPHAVIDWLQTNMRGLENSIKSALDIYGNQHVPSQWAKCAPPGARVLISRGRWSNYNTVPIESLVDGDTVVAFDRRRARMTERPVSVSSIPYEGELINVTTSSEETRVTPTHKWLVKLDAPREACVVYMMRKGLQFRIGRCRAVTIDENRKNGRLSVRRRANQERADSVWILKFFHTRKEAAIYESQVSTQFGLPTVTFEPVTGGNPTHFDREALGEFYQGLNPLNQARRAYRCLTAHGLSLDCALVDGIGYGTKESVAGLVLHTANLIPGMMSIPLPLRGGGIEWKPVKKTTREQYQGPVHSLDVAEHHKYVQDGMVTCNSICGIGPVISAGLLAHIDIEKAPTVGHIWSFAGLNPESKWEKGQKRPWNASLKRLSWIIGESFVKQSGNSKDFYGKLLIERKDYEWKRNLAGELSEQAREKLAKFKIGKSTDAHKWYSGRVTREAAEACLAGKELKLVDEGQGVPMLPPGHIHARAKRWGVKLFLSGYHHVAYETFYGEKPPKPYILTQEGGHAHEVTVPNWPMA